MAAQQQHSNCKAKREKLRHEGEGVDRRSLCREKRVAEVETQFNRYNAEEKFGVKGDLREGERLTEQYHRLKQSVLIWSLTGRPRM